MAPVDPQQSADPQNSAERLPLLLPAAALTREFILPDAPEPLARTAVQAPRFVFRLGPFTFAIHIFRASQLLDIEALRRLPYTPDWLAGIANIRGQLVPVFDLQRYLGDRTPPTTGKQRLLLLGERREMVAIRMPELPMRRLFSPTERLQQMPPIPAGLHGMVHGAYVDKQGIWLDLDHETLLRRLAEQLQISAADAA